MKDLSKILEINKIITSTLDLKTLLNLIMTEATKIVNAQASSLMLLDEKTHQLYFDIAIGEKGTQLKQIRLNLGEGIAGWVAENAQAVIVNDVKKDKRFFPKIDEKINFKTESILCVPLLIKNHIIGVMEVINALDKKGFTDEDKDILLSFASQAAIAIENARLFNNLKEEKEKIETIFKNMKEGVLIINNEDEIVIFNETADNLFSIKQRNIKNFIELENDFELFPKWQEVKNKKISFIEMKRKKGKTFYIGNYISRFPNSKIPYLIMLLRDITEEKKESLLTREFFSLISHKLKTPLTSILGYISLLLSQSDIILGDFQRNSLGIIDKEAKRLYQLVEELLSFTLVESQTLDLDKQNFSLETVIKELLFLSGLKDEYPNAEILVDNSVKKTPVITGDKQRIKQVIEEFVRNGLKFNSKKNKKITISTKTDGENIYISVTDNGNGIPPEEKEKIFNKFYQVEEYFTGQIEGAGLGLSMVKKIVEAHNGKVFVESEINIGSTFTIMLPQ